VGRMKTLFGKDLKVIGRNRTLVVTLIVYPLLMVGIIGLVFAEPNQPVPVAIVIGSEGNQPLFIEGTEVSIRMIEEEIDRVARAVPYQNTAAAEEALRNGEVDAVLIFPDFFLADLVHDFTKRVQLTVILDHSDPAKSMVAENVIRASIQRFNQEIVAYKVDQVVQLLDIILEDSTAGGGQIRNFYHMRQTLQSLFDDPNTPSGQRERIRQMILFVDVIIEELERGQNTITSIALPIDTRITHIESGVLAARDIVVPAAVALSIFWTGILATASLVVYERESHAQARLNMSPVGMPSIIASKLLVTGLIIIAQSVLIVGVARILWGIRLDSMPLLVTVILCGAYAAVGLGLLVAGLARDTNGTTLLSVLAIFPMMFLSGLFFPISFMPRAAQVIASFVPLTYAVDGLRGAMLRNYSVANAQTDLLVLVLLGTVAMVVGYVRNAHLARRH
jgi:ABC-type multidrug transport system permease subunit